MTLSHNILSIFFILTLISLSIRTTNYCRLLFINIHISSQKPLSEKLNIPINRKIISKANYEFKTWTFYILPITIISTSLLSYIWWHISWIGPLTNSLLIPSIILITTTLTFHIQSDPYPDWLISWLIIINSTLKLLIIESIQNRLASIKQQLIEHQSNNNLSTQQLNLLKYEALSLSKQAHILNNNIPQAEQIQKLLQ